MRKTKIICTVGPATKSEEMLEKIMLKGMNIARLNFSHQGQEQHKEMIDCIKTVREKLDLPVAIMLDTKGPEIRTGDFENGQIEVKEGNEFTLTTRDIVGNEGISKITYKNLPNDIEVGAKVLIDDGLIELDVIEKDDENIKCIVKNGGIITNHKGVNVPDVEVNLPPITEKDIEDIKFGIENDVDFIAASFIRKCGDILEIKKILEDNNGDHIKVIAKIENREGVDNLDEIINVSDGIMVARGDLGVEISPEEVPLVQKMMIKKCNEAGKPVITATQMLDSMMRNPRPTRAEVTDVANAIIDGTDAIMLSGESAAGKYPEESVQTMVNIAVKTEASLDYKELLRSKTIGKDINITNAISHATCATAQDLGAKAILTPTSTGYTARAVSKYRPKSAIIAITPNERAMRRLSLVWGVYPVIAQKEDSIDKLIETSINVAVGKKYVNQGDLLVITAGVPVGEAGSTNLIKVHIVDEVVLTGTGIGKKSVSGKVRLALNREKFKEEFNDGDIIVDFDTDKEIIEYIERASAIIVENSGITSHAAIVGLSLGIPVVLGAKDATTKLSDGDIVTVDGVGGYIYKGEMKVL